MFKALRVVGSIVAGLALAFVLVIAIEFGSLVLYPPPPGFNQTHEEMCEYVANYPQWVLALVVPAWAGITFASTWIARRIGNRGAGLTVGLLLLAGFGFNVASLPYPTWFKLANLLAVPIAIFLALRSPSRQETSDAVAVK